jgi:tetratricopeptide (TPR) repeat protein
MDALTRLPDTEELRRRHIDVILGYLNFSWGTAVSDDGFALATQAEELAQSLQNPDGTRGDRRRLARIHLMTAGAHLALCEYRETVRYVRQVLAQASLLGDDTAVATASAQFGVVRVLQGHFAEAEPYLVRVIGLLDQTPDRWEWFSCVGALGMSLAMRGRTGEGLALVERALARAEATGNAFGITQSCAFLSAIYLELGDMPRLLKASERAIEAAVRSGHPVYSSLGLGFRALAESRLGQLAEAQDTLVQSDEVKAKFGGKLMMGDWLDAIGAEVMYNAGRTQEALALADRTVEMAQSVGGIFAEGWARRIRGQALARLEPPRRKEAEEEFAESVRLFEACDARLEAARTRDAWGRSDEGLRRSITNATED